jgi:hypothetical protein
MANTSGSIAMTTDLKQSMCGLSRPSDPDQASFLLEVVDSRQRFELLQGLHEFDPILLLFLRTLTRVVLRLQMSDRGSGLVKTILKTTITDHSVSVTTIRHYATKTDSTTVKDHQDEFQERHFVFNHDVGELPLESRREGCITSRLTIAFPVTGLPEKRSVTKAACLFLAPHLRSRPQGRYTCPLRFTGSRSLS